MYKRAFEYCCGMQEIGDLDDSYPYLKQAIADHLSELTKEREDIDAGYGNYSPGALMATTLPSQKAAIKALKFHKFRRLMSFTNPGTGNKVTLWIKKLVK